MNLREKAEELRRLLIVRERDGDEGQWLADIERALLEARREALEEAAKVADDVDVYGEGWFSAQAKIVGALRSLASDGKEPADE